MQPSAQRAGSKRLEVLICTHNRAGLLERTLDSLNACSRPAGCDVSVFVVANACTDDTVQYLETYLGSQQERGSLPLRWIEEPRPGKSQALNTAIPQVTAEVIAFVDDDHRVDPGYLAAVCAAAHEHPEADLLCGRILPDWDGTEPDWVHDEGQYRIYPLPVPRFELGSYAMPVEPGTASPGGGNLAIRRELYDRVGPFLLELGPHGHDLGGAEDIEWVRRAVAGGAGLYYVPDMLQFHYVDGARLTLRYVMAKAYERSASLIRLSSELADRPRLPPNMIRKAGTYAFMALASLTQRRRRFYLTRLAAALGEIKGFRLLHKRRRAERNL
jgi:glycosyltransferase involved in cell wall biosynthesis